MLKTTFYTKSNGKIIDRNFNLLRKIISKLANESDEKIKGDIELDESCFGLERIRRKWGRGVNHKISVFGLLKRDSKVYVKIVKNCFKEKLMPIIK